MIRLGHAPLLLAVAAVWAPGAAAGQTGTLIGTVLDAETGAPIRGASVEIVGATSAQTLTVQSEQDGSFTGAVREGRYFVVVVLDGYATERVGPVSVRAGITSSVTVSVMSNSFLLSPIIVAVSRTPERAIESAAQVSVVRAEDMERRVTASPMENLSFVAGVDAARTGLLQSSIVARGFNDVYPTSMLILADHRNSSLPMSRLNANWALPISDLDIERMEVTLGPGSAVYGPNAANGVAHIFTKGPIDYPGSSISLSGGERSVFNGQFRTAFAPTERFGFKLSGQYFKGTNWEWIDPAEEAALQFDPTNPRIAARDFGTERWGGDARFDFRPDEDTEWVTTVGLNMNVENVDLSGAGRTQQVDYRSHYLQTRFERGLFFVQAYGNFQDAGDSHFYRTGQDVITNSRMLVGQVQHGATLFADRVTATYGFDAQRTDTKTGGTITGRFEDDDLVDEVGGYVHTVTQLHPKLDLVGALRLDHHSRLSDLVASPRVGLVFKPREGHALRGMFNRAFVNPDPISLFVDFVIAPIAPGLDFRAVGVPQDGGLTFGTCVGGLMDLCMRAPGVQGEIPANAVVAWDALVAALDPALAPLLPNPGAAVGTVLRRFDLNLAGQGQYPFVLDPRAPSEIEPLRPTITNSFELGYKGLFDDRLLTSVSVFYSRIKDFVSGGEIETPSVFLDPTTTAAYVNAQLAPLVAGGALTQAQVDALAQGLSLIPIGTVTPQQWDAPDILVTNVNFGDYDLWGFELGGVLRATDSFTVEGSFSYLSDDCFDGDGDGVCLGTLDKAVNAPKVKGSIATRFQTPDESFFAEVRMRAVDGFPMAHGVFVGEVSSYATWDLSLGFPVQRLPGATVSFSAMNVFDHTHRELVGGAPIGRLAALRLRYDF